MEELANEHKVGMAQQWQVKKVEGHCYALLTALCDNSHGSRWTARAMIALTLVSTQSSRKRRAACYVLKRCCSLVPLLAPAGHAAGGAARQPQAVHRGGGRHGAVRRGAGESPPC